MNTNDRTKVIQLITVAAVCFFVLILTALIINLVKLASLSHREKQLTEELARLEAQIEANQGDIDYRKTEEFVDRYAREYLNMIGKDELIFIGK